MAGRVAREFTGTADVMHASIGPHHTKFALEGRSGIDGRGQGALRIGEIEWMHAISPQIEVCDLLPRTHAIEAIHLRVPAQRPAVDSQVPDPDPTAMDCERRPLIGRLHCQSVIDPCSDILMRHHCACGRCNHWIHRHSKPTCLLRRIARIVQCEVRRCTVQDRLNTR